jgi:oligosaccharide translocation protein RFT1
MSELRTGIRVRAEGLGVLSKTVLAFLLLLYDSRIEKSPGKLALFAFAVGQLAYASVLLLVYLAYYPSIPWLSGDRQSLPWSRLKYV